MVKVSVKMGSNVKKYFGTRDLSLNKHLPNVAVRYNLIVAKRHKNGRLHIYLGFYNSSKDIKSAFPLESVECSHLLVSLPSTNCI